METKHKTKYQTGYERSRPSLGALQDVNTQPFELPAIGRQVVLQEVVTYSKKVAMDKEDEHSKYAGYRYINLDPWNKPKVYRVVEYTHGIENPREPKNKMMLEYSPRKGVLFKTSIPTNRIAAGYIRCVEVE